MSEAKQKTINLLLYDGDLSGVISMEASSWNSGELYSTPRESVDDLLKTDACKKSGVYLLLSKNMVYVGQASDLAKRITQHKVGKDWWESVVILTAKDNSLTHSDIDYLEATLIEKANKIGKLDIDNKNKGNPIKVDKYRKVFLEQYLQEALFLMRLIGITVFANDAKPSLFDIKTKLSIGKRSKSEAISYLNEKGVTVDNKATYAVRNEKGEFWANPQRKLLSSDWWLILNDNKMLELVVMNVPVGMLHADESNNGGGLYVRSDKPQLMDLNINADTLIDRKSGISFSDYLIKRVSYK